MEPNHNPTTSAPIRSVDLFCNDLYQFTCSYSYFKQQKHEQIATFEIFFRKYPFKGEYVIFAGLESVKDFIRSVRFSSEHEKYLKEIFPGTMSQEYFQWVKQDFSEKVHFKSMKEGEIVFANEPLLTYTGPLGFIQLLETPFLNLLGFASLVATNASRMTKAVEPKKCLEFGTRRAQGPDGALSAAQYAYLGGFAATSNVKVAQTQGIQCIGTMSHAYVTSFDSLQSLQNGSHEQQQKFIINGNNIILKSLEIRKKLNLSYTPHEGELAAFLSYASSFPNNFTTLIDTYSTLESGLMNTVIVGGALIEIGIRKIGVRLDSGDLCELSKKCRQIWNSYYPEVGLTIVASDDLYEERLKEMASQGSEIDVYAIGTNIATCKKQPALGLVCKLVNLDNVPKMKLSSTPQKATYPAVKSIFRVQGNRVSEGKGGKEEEGSEGAIECDIVALESEERIAEGMKLRVGTIKQGSEIEIDVKKSQLLNQKVDVSATLGIEQAKQHATESRNGLDQRIFDLDQPKSYQVYMTEQYLQVFRETLHRAELNAKTK